MGLDIRNGKKFLNFLVATSETADACRSIVGVTDGPALEDNTAGSPGVDHTTTEEHLPELVVEDDNHEEGDGRDGEVREGDHAGAEHSVEERHVAEDGDEGGLEEESEVGVPVDHALLRDGEVPGLADEEIGPLDTDN